MAAALDRVTVKLALAVPLVGSVRLTLPTEMVGAGVPSRMVPVPVPCARLAPLAPESASWKPSLPSTRASALTATVTTLLVSPAAKVTLPLAAVKSVPAWAVPSTVA